MKKNKLNSHRKEIFMKRALSFGLFLMSLSISVMAQNFKEGDQKRRHHQEVFTETERVCLENLLGKKGQGQPPSEEKMKSAFESCQIDKAKLPPAPPQDGEKRRPRPHQEMMDESESGSDNSYHQESSK